MGIGVATLEVAEGEGDELELVVPVIGGTEVVEEGGTLVLLGVVLVVEEGVGCSVVVVVGTGLLPKDQVPYMTPCASVPPKEWKRPLLKSKSPAPQLSHWDYYQRPRNRENEAIEKMTDHVDDLGLVRHAVDGNRDRLEAVGASSPILFTRTALAKGKSGTAIKNLPQC